MKDIEKRNNLYIIYDTFDNELPVYFGTSKEVCKAMNISKQILSYHYVHRVLLKSRYIVERAD